MAGLRLFLGPKSWYFYVLLCADGTYYAGVTKNLSRRLYEHNHTNKGAKYTKPRRPVRRIFVEPCYGRSEAQKMEAKFKRLSRTQKEQMVSIRPGRMVRQCDAEDSDTGVVICEHIASSSPPAWRVLRRGKVEIFFEDELEIVS